MKTDYNTQAPNTAPFKPQEQYVDALVQRVTDNALQQAANAAVKPAWKRPLAATAAAAAVILAVVLSLFLIHPTASHDSNRLASVGNKEKAPVEHNLAKAEPVPEPKAEVATTTDDDVPAPAETPVMAHNVKSVSQTSVETDPVDAFLDTLSDDQLAALSDDYYDEIPEY